MTRNQLAASLRNFASNAVFEVDTNGAITPNVQQIVSLGGTITVKALASATSPYAGYVCAWRNGACRCSDIISDLGTERHMKIRSTAYNVRSNAPDRTDYVIYATLTETGTGPSSMASNGNLHVGST